MNGLQIICIGILLVVIGTLFSLLGNIGSIMGFIIAIAVIGHIIKSVREEKVSFS